MLELGSLSPDGNLIDDGRFQYAWDAEHRLISATPVDTASGLKKVVLAHDALSRRIRTQVYAYTAGSSTVEQKTTFVYDGWNVIKATTTTGNAISTDSSVWSRHFRFAT